MDNDSFMGMKYPPLLLGELVMNPSLWMDDESKVAFSGDGMLSLRVLWLPPIVGEVVYCCHSYQVWLWLHPT